MHSMGDGAQIYLSKPGGRREGPFTLERIKEDLAAKKYDDTDFWAWHEGLPEWVPLYKLTGSYDGGAPAAPTVPAAVPVAESPEPTATAAPLEPQTESLAGDAAATSPVVSAPAPEPSAATTPLEREVAVSDHAVAEAGAVEPAAVAEPQPSEAPPPAEVASGMPFAALDHIFLLTSGDGPATWESPEVGRMLEAIIGTELSIIRLNVAREVIGRCVPGELMKPDGSISEAAWRAMAAHQPDLVQQARERLYRVCVRTFSIEADTLVALVLFYSKEKL